MLSKLSNDQKDKLFIIIKSYAYAALVAVAAVYTSGNHDFKSLLDAALMGILAPIAAAGNPKDTSIGIGAPKEDFSASDEANAGE